MASPFFLFLTILFFPPSSFSASTFPFFSFSLLPSGCSELHPVSLSLCQAGDTGDSCVTPLCHPLPSPAAAGLSLPKFSVSPPLSAELFQGRDLSPKVIGAGFSAGPHTTRRPFPLMSHSSQLP